MELSIKIILIILGLTGFSIAAYIRHSKLYTERLTCPIGFDCNTVVESKYAKFLGFPVEILGMFYYGLVAVGYFISLFIYVSESFSFIIAALSFIAFIFSVYLTAVQAFVLKQWCSWCLVSAGLSTAIFIITAFF